jgi:glycosyltransferase involved in cell wall biosynthesis
LESLQGFAGEIVVLVDASTTDKTEELARAAGCKVSRRAFDDYAAQRQAALDLCTKEWVLWIDCDERLSERPAFDGCAAYRMPFRVKFLGKVLNWGGLGSETHVRFFQRTKAKFVGGALHEGLEISGETGPLTGRIEHEPYKDLSEYLAKLDRYTTLAARKKYESGRRACLLDHAVLPWELFRRVVLRLAFLDGWQGLVWAGLSAFHHWLKYAKLKEMENAR